MKSFINSATNSVTGKRTYIVAILMILHGSFQIIMDVLNGNSPSDIAVLEVFNGFAVFFLRKAV